MKLLTSDVAYLLFNILDVIYVSVEEVSHRIFDGGMFERGGNPKHDYVRYSGAQLSHSLSLKRTTVTSVYQCVKKDNNSEWITQKQHQTYTCNEFIMLLTTLQKMGIC